MPLLSRISPMKVKNGTASSVSFAMMPKMRSGSAGGLVRWPARLLVPAGFCLLSLQGLSELVKRIAYLKGLIPDPVEHHEDPALEQIHVEEAK